MENGLTRRQGLQLAALAAGAAAAPAMATAPKAGSFLTKVDFKNPVWNRDTYARLDGDLDFSKQKLGWIHGKAFGVRPNEPVRHLFDVEGFSVTRIKRTPEGDWQRLLREIVFYRDPKTKEIMKEWHNPYSNETVRVVPIANDPFNFVHRAYKQAGPEYGGLRADAKSEPEPYLLDWTEGPNGTLIVQTGIDMQYPNALQPDKWPRESSGPMNRVSEHFIYTMKREDVENPNLTHIPHIGAWSRITPWLPWMLMGQAPGHISYFTSFQTSTEDQLPADLVAATRAMDEKWFIAPTEDVGPSLSSLEWYAREQKPAPVPQGWTPPQPPAAPTFR